MRTLFHLVCTYQRRTFPLALRHKWLKKLRHHKVMLAISSGAGRVHIDGTVPVEMQSALGAKAVRPYPRKKGSKARKEVEEEGDGVDESRELATQALRVISRPGKSFSVIAMRCSLTVLCFFLFLFRQTASRCVPARSSRTPSPAGS